MSLSPATREAVLEVVKRLRDPMRSVAVDSLGWEVYASQSARRSRLRSRSQIRAELRSALGVSGISSLADWTRGKSREEVAEALERIATSSP